MTTGTTTTTDTQTIPLNRLTVWRAMSARPAKLTLSTSWRRHCRARPPAIADRAQDRQGPLCRHRRTAEAAGPVRIGGGGAHRPGYAHPLPAARQGRQRCRVEPCGKRGARGHASRRPVEAFGDLVDGGLAASAIADRFGWLKALS